MLPIFECVQCFVSGGQEVERMMPTPQTPPSLSSNPPLDPHPIVLQPACPYFTQKQISALSTRLRSPVLSENKEIQIRLQACFWIEEVGNLLQ
jgi:hypothetical protein